MIIKKHRARKLLLLSRLLILAAFGVLATGAYLSWRQHQANLTADQQADQTVQQSQDDTVAPPSTKKPSSSEFDTYKVAADTPRYLFIQDIRVRAMVKPVGVTRDNQIEAPRSAFDTGWYNASAKPGQAGAMLIDGHVSGGAIPGIFYNLKDLQPGDTVQIQRGDGVLLTYQVVKSMTYDADKVDMDAALTPATPGKPGLNLITCTGAVVRGTNDYDKRLVVFTEQL